MNTIDSLRLAALAGLIASAVTLPAYASEGHDETAAKEETVADGDNHGPEVTRLLLPNMNSARGMDLFIDKGCYTCHAVNGVGGHDAAALDAHDMDEVMNPFELAARMWRMASIMIPAQEEALGEQIEFTGDELSDIIAFLHDDQQQHKFTDDLLSEEQMAAMNHEHGGMKAMEAHEEEIGHADGGAGGHGDGDGEAGDHDEKVN